MNPTFVRLLTATALGAGVIAAVSVPGGREACCQGKDPGARERNARYSARYCTACHGGKDNPFYRDEAKDKKSRSTEFVRLDEHEIWLNLDLHSQAAANIDPKNNGIAKRMQDALGRHRPDYAIERAAECLTCHAVDLTLNQAPAVPLAEKRFEDFEARYGVSCEACHGLAEKWEGPHKFPDPWRKTTPEDKANLGLIDIRDPYVKAMKCASCHIGNKAEGKFVTHEMYAAGHPPLPPFELVTYARDQPAHAFPHRENAVLRDQAKADPDATWKLFHYRLPADEQNPNGECPDARTFAVGSVAGFETAMKLLAQDAEAVAKRPGEVLDFAHFDCFACHHDLKVPSERQRPRAGIAPGRPPMRPWATETLQAVFAHGATAVAAKDRAAMTTIHQGFGDRLAKLNAAFSGQPFGDPKTVAREAAALAADAGAARPLLEPLVYTPAETRKLYDRLVERLTALRGRKDNQAGADGLYLDHDTAQQLAWGLVALKRELGGTAEYPDLNKVVALRLWETERQSVERRLSGRYNRLYHFKAADFYKASDQLLTGPGGK
jgi:hypothetical protein